MTTFNQHVLDSLPLLEQLVPSLQQKRVINLLSSVTPSTSELRTPLAKKRYFSISQSETKQFIKCPYINLFSPEPKPASLPPFSFKSIEGGQPWVDSHLLKSEQSVSHQLRVMKWHAGENRQLESTVLVFQHISPENHCIYYNEIDYFSTRSRKLFWNQPERFWELAKHTDTTAREQISPKLLIDSIPTDLSLDLTDQTPLYVELSLLIRTKDQRFILNTADVFFEDRCLLDFSAHEPLKMLTAGVDPLKQLSDLLMTKFNHHMNDNQLDRLLFGIDCHDYSQQLIYVYNLEIDSHDLFEAQKNSPNEIDNHLFAVPINSDFIFQLCQHYSCKPALSYVMLRECQLNTPKGLKFKWCAD